jgi:hypothetical protein
MVFESFQFGPCERQGAVEIPGPTRGPEVVATQGFYTPLPCAMTWCSRRTTGVARKSDPRSLALLDLRVGRFRG